MTTKAPPLGQPADSASANDMIFVAGLHRSGTTLVEHWLSALYEVAFLRAPVPENEGQHLQDVYPPAKRHGGPGEFAFASEMHPAPPPAEDAPLFRTRLLTCWTPWCAGGPDHPILEKSPPNLTKIPWLRAVFPGARFLIVVRDPRAVSMATHAWKGQPLARLLEHYHIAHTSALNAFSATDCLVLRYETFISDPVQASATVADSFGLHPRAIPLEIEPRFQTIEDRNAHYIEDFPRDLIRSGSWEPFGYRL